MEDETYSVIFTSLKHPVRRRMLRMLADKPLTFSEIQESLAIDSGHLSYHLESLGELVAHAQDGKYRLSSIGTAAVKLMGGVEEHRPETPGKRLKFMQSVAHVYPLILAGALLIASLYALNYTAYTATTALGDSATATPIHIGPGQTMKFDITIEYTPSANAFMTSPETRPLNVMVTAGLGMDTISIQKTTPTKTVTANERGVMWLDLALNLTSFYPNLASLSSGFGIADNGTVFPLESIPAHALVVHEPDGTISTGVLHWTSMNEGITHASSASIEVSQPGTYRFELKNDGAHSWDGNLTPNVFWQLQEKPYFLYGIAGLVIAVGYVVFSAVGSLRNRKTKKDFCF